jgi:NADH-quinone oxidoreductase subunit G
MAAVATETVTISINNVDLQVPKGELIVEAVKRLGLEIPIFCYHPRMKPVGMCRMCLVEVGFKQPDGSVRKMPKPQAGCTLPASEGMVVYTDSELVHRDRKGVLEFLLINHPLDCPICDRGGECPLQNNTIFYGPSTSRFIEVKRHAHKAFPLSKFVALDLERCIQCGRCVRFTEEISGDSELAFRFRGAEMQPSTYELRDFTSKFSGNVIEICPVGALTNREYRFRARPWDLETRPSVCTLCSNGCNIWFDYRVGKLVRVNGRTNEAVNEEWTCDRGKFGHDDLYNPENRLTVPLLRQGDRLVETDWPTAYAEIARAFSAGGDKVGLLGGNMVSNEGLHLMKTLFGVSFKSTNTESRWTATPGSARRVDDTIAGLESKSAILAFGTSLADEVPIIFLRVRKAWFQNETKVIVAHSADTDADTFAHLILRYKPGTEAALAKALAGQGDVSALAAECGVPLERIQEAGVLLKENAAILTTDVLLNQPNGPAALETLSGIGASFNRYPLAANDFGAEKVGFNSAQGAEAMLRATRDGQMEALWLLGNDPFEAGLDHALVREALENVPCLVVQTDRQSEAFGYASVVLPMTLPGEQDGTYTNAEGRVQRIKAVLTPRGESKPAWKVASEILLRTSPQKPYFNAEEVFASITAFDGIKYGDFDGEGVR